MKPNADKINAQDGERDVGSSNAQRPERDGMHQLLIADARAGLADVAAGRTRDAASLLNEVKRRRAARAAR
ncbi:MAG: prevent-host-death protein [Burkholderiales bacterium]|nr:prevent-host-death protein [Burkholderiales bacterium]